MAKKPEFVSVANVWPAESSSADKEAMRQAAKRLSAINPAEAVRIKRLAGEVAR